MTRARALLFVLLVCSVAANGYLLLTRTSSEPERSTRHVEPRARGSSAIPASDVVRNARELRESYKQRERAELEQRLANVEARIEELRPLPEKYASALRSPDTETLVAPLLDRVFKVTPGSERGYHVECHGRVCKLDTITDLDEWRDALHKLPEKAMLGTLTFSHGRTFFDVLKPEQLPTQYVGGIHSAFWSAPETRACIAAHQARGDLLLDLRFIPSSRTFRVTASGTLATHPVGACLRSVLESITQRLSVPPQIESFPAVPVHVELPVSPAPP